MIKSNHTTKFFFCILIALVSFRSISFQGVILPEQKGITEAEKQEIELALSSALNRGGILTNINQTDFLCKEVCNPTSRILFEDILSTYPDTEIVFFYNNSSVEVSSVIVVDALTMDVLTTASLPKGGQVDNSQRFADLGALLLESLEQRRIMTRLTIELHEFSMDEMATVSSFLLSLSENNQIKLIETKQVESNLSSLLPIIKTSYALTTDVPVNHLIDEFIRFWQLQSVDVTTNYNRMTGLMTVTRVGSPYWPSLVSLSIALLVCFVLLFWVTKRKNIHHHLALLSDQKKADDWLDLYTKSDKPWIGLDEQWSNSANYWRQIKRESQQLETQAKLFYDAGDTNTAKLFISKALNINTSSPIANKLVRRIQDEEKNTELLNDNEQWIRNKIAKAMINYRNDNFYKALRQAYQAEARCTEHKALKKQLKAIKKLVSKILFQSALTVDRVQIRMMDSIDILSIGCEDQVLIGRDDSWIPEKGVGIMQFMHKGLSRIGRHAKLEVTEAGLQLSELGSTNGTFINSKKLKKGETRLLHNNDLLLLAAKTHQQGLAQCVKTINHLDSYCLEVPQKDVKDGNAAVYANNWPDYVQAAHRKFVMTKRSVFVCMSEASSELFVTVEKPNTKNTTPLFIISLTPYLTIEPVPSVSIRLKEEEVIGKVPLQLPAEITYKSTKIQILANEYSYSSEYTKSNIQSGLNITNVEN